MRQYKNLFIPDRLKRTIDSFYDKQKNYCHKSDCFKDKLDCNICLFSEDNIAYFKNWYIAKNKIKNEAK